MLDDLPGRGMRQTTGTNVVTEAQRLAQLETEQAVATAWAYEVATFGHRSVVDAMLLDAVYLKRDGVVAAYLECRWFKGSSRSRTVLQIAEKKVDRLLDIACGQDVPVFFAVMLDDGFFYHRLTWSNAYARREGWLDYNNHANGKEWKTCIPITAFTPLRKGARPDMRTPSERRDIRTKDGANKKWGRRDDSSNVLAFPQSPLQKLAALVEGPKP